MICVLLIINSIIISNHITLFIKNNEIDKKININNADKENIEMLLTMLIFSNVSMLLIYGIIAFMLILTISFITILLQSFFFNDDETEKMLEYSWIRVNNLSKFYIKYKLIIIPTCIVSYIFLGV